MTRKKRIAALAGAALLLVLSVAIPGGGLSSRARAASLTTYAGPVHLYSNSVRLGGTLRASLPLVFTTLFTTYPIFWSLDSLSGQIEYPLLAGQGRQLKITLPGSLPTGTYELVADVQSDSGGIEDYVSRPIKISGNDGMARTIARYDYQSPFTIYQHQDMLWTFARGDLGQHEVLALYENSRVNSRDVAAFDAEFGLPAAHIRYQGGAGMAGGASQSEATMDVEWAHAMAPDATLVVYDQRRFTIQGIANAIRSAAENGDGAFSTSVVQPNLLSSSSAYLRRVSQFNDSLVATATSEGLAIFSAAGDHGEITPQTSDTTNHFTWPSTNDYVVAVGGTQWNGNQETYWNSGRSQGTLWAGAYGYTDNFAVPSWQATQWNNLGLAPAANRYVPDVSMVANNAMVYNGGQWQIDGGTSLAAPCWAGVWVLAQTWHRRVAGQPIGPNSAVSYLYQVGQDTQLALPGFNDQGAYTAAPFYKFTGFGSPNVTNLIQDLATIDP